MLISSVFLSIALFIVSFASEDNKDLRSPRVPRIPANNLNRLKKRQGDQGYVEQCRVTNLWKEQLGYVNVFAFLDPSWQYSYRQAIMLKLLKKRLEKASFSDIWFFIVAAPPDLPEDKAGNDIEIQAWKDISTFNSQKFFESNELLLNLHSKSNDTDIIFIQDTPELGIWKNFRASKDQIVVIDRCGKLAYQIIVPWSILYYPYVKAAILSTYREDPCGECDVQPTSITEINYEDYPVEKTNEKEEITTPAADFYESTTADINETNENTETPTLQTIKSKSFSNYVDFHTTLPSFEQNTTEIEITSLNDGDKVTTSMSEFLSDGEETRVVTVNLATTENYEKLREETPVISKRVEEQEDISVRIPEETRKKEDEVQDWSTFPIRILMRAPHLHQEDGTLKKYTHLILKTGNPEYHEHPQEDTILSDPQEAFESEKSNATVQKELSEYVYSQDESPGFYGEIADYWKNDDDQRYTNKDLTRITRISRQQTERDVLTTLSPTKLTRQGRVIQPQK